MGFNLRLSLCIAAIILCSSFLLYIVIEGLTVWGKIENDMETTMGLWLECSSEGGERACWPLICSLGPELDMFCTKIIISRVFVTVACGFSGAATFFLVVYIMTCDNRNQILLVSIKFFAVISFVTGAVGVPIGIHALGIGDGVTFGIGCILGIVTIGLNFLGALAILLVKHQSSTKKSQIE